MNQIVRRLMYFIFGVVPACLGTAFAIVLGPFVLAAAAGTIGLIVASLMRFPLATRSYGRVALLLILGLVIAVPLGIMTLFVSLSDGIMAKNLPALSLTIWVFLGPIMCAAHFLSFSRRAPNNSFKPTPLRGVGKVP